MSKRQVLGAGIVLAAIFAVAVFAGSGGVMAPSDNCSHVGTFFGESGGATWMVANSPGKGVTEGQMVVEWVSWDPTFGGGFPAVRTTNPMGVWEKVNEKIYKFTWVAYGLGADGSVVYVARASGVSTTVDCDHLNFTFVMEFFSPAQDISKDPPAFGCMNGEGTETRMLLVQAACLQ